MKYSVAKNNVVAFVYVVIYNPFLLFPNIMEQQFSKEINFLLKQSTIAEDLKSPTLAHIFSASCTFSTTVTKTARYEKGSLILTWGHCCDLR